MSDWLNIPGVKEELEKNSQPAVGIATTEQTQQLITQLATNHTRMFRASLFGSGAMWSAFFGLGIVSGLWRGFVFGIAYYVLTAIFDNARAQIVRGKSAGSS